MQMILLSITFTDGTSTTIKADARRVTVYDDCIVVRGGGWQKVRYQMHAIRSYAYKYGTAADFEVDGD